MPRRNPREIRRVSGRDPVLDVQAYRQWENALPAIYKIDKKTQIFNCVCKLTLEAIEGGTRPPTIDQILEDVPMGRSTLKEHMKSLRKEELIDQLGSGNTFWYRATVKGLERYIEECSDE